jgi:hypothetical protein
MVCVGKNIPLEKLLISRLYVSIVCLATEHGRCDARGMIERDLPDMQFIYNVDEPDALSSWMFHKVALL